MLKKIEKQGKVLLARFLSIFLRTEKITPGALEKMTIRRILVIRQQNQMGDMLCAVPAFRGIKRRFPGAAITLVAAPINSDVARANPYVDEVLVYDKARHRSDPFELPRFIRGLRRRDFDLAIVLNTVSFSTTSMLLAVASGAGIRTGSSSRSFGYDITSGVYHLELPLPSPSELAGMHEAEHNLFPLRRIGVDEKDLTSRVVPAPADMERAAGISVSAGADGCGYLVVHPGAGKKQNIWPPARFASVAEQLRKEYGLAVIVLSGPVDSGSLSEFLSACDRPPVEVSCPGIGLMAALMREASLTLCNDTGVMHIAGAAGARCVAVFGPTEPARWKPVNRSVVAVKSLDGDIRSVKIDEVLEAARKLLEEVAPGRPADDTVS